MIVDKLLHIIMQILLHQFPLLLNLIAQFKVAVIYIVTTIKICKLAGFLVIPTVLFGVYPAPILDAIHYSVSTLIYLFDGNIVTCDAPKAWASYFLQDTTSYYATVLAIASWAILVPLAIEVFHYLKDNQKIEVRRIVTILSYCLTIQNIILVLYTLYIIVNLFFVVSHIVSIELPILFSEQFDHVGVFSGQFDHVGIFSGQFAHAGVDSEFVANKEPNLNVFARNTAGIDGHHHHPSCTCPHEETADMPASESQNNRCCLCGGDHPDSACVSCDCQMHESCLANTTYDSVIPNNGNNGNNGNSGNTT